MTNRDYEKNDKLLGRLIQEYPISELLEFENEKAEQVKWKQQPKKLQKKTPLAEEGLKSSHGKDSLNDRQKYYEKSTFILPQTQANEPAQTQSFRYKTNINFQTENNKLTKNRLPIEKRITLGQDFFHFQHQIKGDNEAMFSDLKRKQHDHVLLHPSNNHL